MSTMTTVERPRMLDKRLASDGRAEAQKESRHNPTAKATVDWAVQMRKRLRRGVDELLVAGEGFRRMVNEFVCRRGYALLGFRRFVDFVRAAQPEGLGVTDKRQFYLVLAAVGEQLAAFDDEAQPELEPPATVKDGKQLPPPLGGNSSLLLLKQLAKRRPDVMERFRQGEFASVQLAAIAGGIRQPPDVVVMAQRLIRRFSPAQHVQFGRWYAELRASAK